MTLFPENLNDLQGIIRRAARDGQALIPVSSAFPPSDTDPKGAETVSFEKMNRILKIDRKSRYVRAQAGVTFGDLLPEVKKAGMRLNHPFLPRPQKSAVASLLERNGVIVPKYQYDYHDPLLNAEIVYGNGEVFRSGSAAGPGPFEELTADMVSPWGPGTIDFIRFVCGAQGTMGFVTWATMKAEVLPTAGRLYFISSDDPKKLTRLASDLLLRRVPDDCVILNRAGFAMAFAEDPAQLDLFMKEADPWILLCRICGYERYPKERIRIFCGYLKEMTESIGLKCSETLSFLNGAESRIEERLLDCDRSKVYWKDRTGGCCGTEFLAPPSRAADLAVSAARAAGAGVHSPGIFIQPQVQGRAFRVMLDLYHDASDPGENRSARQVLFETEQALLERGAYFDSPKGPIAEKVFQKDPAGTEALKKLKKIFDPSGIFCPGRLCF